MSALGKADIRTITRVQESNAAARGKITLTSVNSHCCPAQKPAMDTFPEWPDTGISRKNSRMGGSEYASGRYKRNPRSRTLLDSCAKCPGNDGASSNWACIRHSESGSRRSVLLRPILQGSLEVRTIRLRLATSVLFPTLRSLAWGLSSRLDNPGWLVQTLSWVLNITSKISRSSAVVQFSGPPNLMLVSALPPKADMCDATSHVRFGPIADIAANNGCVTKTIHSMTVSAISSRLCGIVKPSVFAALELITNSNFVDRKTGRSAIFSPLSIRPVYTPACLYASGRFVP